MSEYSENLTVADVEAVLRAALQPFADYMHTDEGRLDLDHAGCELPDDLGVGWIYLNHGDFRRAQAALAQKGGE